MTRPLTASQKDAMEMLGNYVGQSILVLTSSYTANVAPAAVREAKTTVNSSTLRGLAARGLITIETAMWKGAQITVNRRAA